ncbi:hypothetical protein CFOL_v3_16263, partial [Cephalotus follicularis]
CRACMKLQKNDDGKWFVKKFEEDKFVNNNNTLLQFVKYFDP